MVGLLPLFEKTHSQGEYVFYHGWANAFEQAVIIGAFGSGSLSDRFANIRIVGKEIFENRSDGGAAVGGFA